MSVTLRPILVALFAVAIAGCGPSQASDSLEPTASAAADANVCPKNSLRIPNGEALRLTGTWRGSDFGEYYISQRESCLYWMGRSAEFDDAAAGHFWTNVFTGRLRSDFTVDGRWGDVPLVAGETSSLNNGELRLKIDFFEVGDTSWPTLHLLEQRGGETFGGLDWVPEGSLPARSEFIGTYGFRAPDCAWIDVAGQRYEIAETPWQYDLAAGGQLVGEGTLVRPGDQIRVEAQVSAPLGRTDCQASAMLVWDLQPAP